MSIRPVGGGAMPELEIEHDTPAPAHPRRAAWPPRESHRPCRHSRPAESLLAAPQTPIGIPTAIASEHATEAQFQAHRASAPANRPAPDCRYAMSAPYRLARGRRDRAHSAHEDGWSSPISSRRLWSCSAVAKLPRRMSAGSPGMSMVSTKMTRLAPSNVGMMSTSRRATWLMNSITPS